MPRAVIRKAVYQRISKAIVEYTCETCGKVCGTRENPKETWYARGDSKYYCKRTCSPAGCRVPGTTAGTGRTAVTALAKT
jgi:hypothetical protein